MGGVMCTLYHRVLVRTIRLKTIVVTGPTIIKLAIMVHMLVGERFVVGQMMVKCWVTMSSALGMLLITKTLFGKSVCMRYINEAETVE